MQLIINADDFGYDEDTVAKTIAHFEQGALSSATIMARMPASERAMTYARKRSDMSFGVHLTYVCDTVETPVSSPGSVPALVRDDGRFLPSNTLRLRALTGRVPVSQIVLETSAQLALVRDHGIRISHVDSHGHLHKFPPFLEALERVLPRFGIDRVRAVQNVYLRRPLSRPTSWLRGGWGRNLRRHFATTEHFYMSSCAGDASWPCALLARNLAGVLEVGVHPGSREEWRRQESNALNELSRLVRVAGHELITWHQVTPISRPSSLKPDQG